MKTGRDRVGDEMDHKYKRNWHSIVLQCNNKAMPTTPPVVFNTSLPTTDHLSVSLFISHTLDQP